MTAMFDWNDLRYFLAVADGGSTLAAGRALRVSQTTVARRIAALEEALGVPLFEKRQAGYTLTDTGADLLERARQMASAATGFADAAAAQVRDTSGTVRITTQEIFAVTLLPPIVRELHEQHALESELVRAVQLRDRVVDARHRHERVADQPVGRHRRVLGEPGVVGLHHRQVRVLVRDVLEEPHREHRREQQLGVDAVLVLLTQPLQPVARPIGARPVVVEGGAANGGRDIAGSR